MENKMPNIEYPSAQPSKAQALMQALGGLGTQNKKQSADGASVAGGDSFAAETISDDFALSDDARLSIQQTEETVRQVLKLFELDYDALVRMDDTSLYARAVQENPAVLAYVKQAQNPVLEALKIAIGFKPYAEFIEKYGKDPDSIKTAMRAEIEAEMKGAKTEKEKDVSFEGTPFSKLTASTSFSAKNKEEDVFSSLFNR